MMDPAGGAGAATATVAAGFVGWPLRLVLSVQTAAVTGSSGA